MNRTSKLLTALLLLVFGIAPVAGAFAQDDAGLLIWADGNRTGVLVELGKKFAEEFGVNVEVQEMGLGDIRDQLQVAGPAGEGPDIVVTVHDTLGQLVANGMLMPVELGDLAEEYLPSAVEAFTVGGVVYGVPYATENVAFVRNPELIPEWPATWQEVAELAAEMAENDLYAFGLQTGNTYHTFPITSAFGGYIFGIDEEGNYDVTDIGLASEGGKASAAWLQMMAENGYLVPDTNDDVVFEWYTDGILGSFVTGPWHLQRLRDSGQPYVLEPFPGVEGVTVNGRPFSGVQGFSISAFTKDPLLAETFVLDYIATQETMQALFDAEPRPSAHLAVREAIDDPDLAAFAAAGADAIPMPNIPEMSAVWAASDNALNLTIQGTVDGPSAYTTAAEQIANTIAGMGQPPTSVTFVGSFQAALGCGADWDPACEVTMLEDQGNGFWVGTFTLPAGDYEAKVALNAAWTESYPSDNIMGTLEAETTLEVMYDHNTHEVTITPVE
ncbi:MAG: extracellular solute-binding protein [Anaerolineae bacterium]|nr:extracellular solute-binding protein [Anaerolineae bacterium]